MLSFGLLLRSMQIRDTVAIFTARIWPGRYMLPLAVSLLGNRLDSDLAGCLVN
jgi:hypothetical protein